MPPLLRVPGHWVRPKTAPMEFGSLRLPTKPLRPVTAGPGPGPGVGDLRAGSILTVNPSLAAMAPDGRGGTGD